MVRGMTEDRVVFGEAGQGAEPGRFEPKLPLAPGGRKREGGTVFVDAGAPGNVQVSRSLRRSSRAARAPSV
jgi:hypothetical protein